MNIASPIYTIYKATIEDVPSIRQIAVITWWHVYPSIISAKQIEYMLEELYNEKLLNKLIESEKQIFYILAEDEVPEAFAAFSPLMEDPDIYKLHKIYIHPNKQSRGYGKAILSRVVEHIKLHEKNILQLNVNRYNPARHFYEKLGFKIIREEDIPIGPYWMNDYVMQLKFDEDWRND